MNTRAAYGHLADGRYRVGVPPNAGKLRASWASSSRQSTAGCRALVVVMFGTFSERPRGRAASWDGMVAGAAPGLQSLGEVETSQVGSTPTPSRHLSSRHLSSRHLSSRQFSRHLLLHCVGGKLQSASNTARMSVRAVHRLLVHRQRSLAVLHVVTKAQS